MNYLKTHILVVEDNYQDFILFKEILSHIRGFFIQIDHADSLKSACEQLGQTHFDIVFLDLFLPDSFGQETFAAVQSVTTAPIIILSGMSDRKIALDIVKQGAQDYILKGEFDANLLEKSIIYSIERKKYQEVLEESERRSRSVFESVGIAIAEYDYTALIEFVEERKAAGKSVNDVVKSLDLAGVKALRSKMRVINLNPEALSLYNCTNKDDFERTYPRFYDERFVGYYQEVIQALWTGKDKMVYELPFINGEGQLIHTLKRWRFLGKQGGFYRLLVSSEDVSRIKENEEKVRRQSMVMEGVAKAAAVLLGDGDINERIKTVISIAGEALSGVCMSVYIFDITNTNEVIYKRTHAWMPGGRELRDAPHGTFSDPQTVDLSNQLEIGEPLLIRRNSTFAEVNAQLEIFRLACTVITPFKTSVGRGAMTLSYSSDEDVPDYVLAGMKTLASSVGSALAAAKAQEDLRQVNEELEQRVDDRTSKMQQAIRELESFSYSVSHDLRAPLRTISGFTGVLHEDYRHKLDEEGRHFLDNIQKGASEMSQLIDDLLNFSRLGRRRLEFDVVPMNKLVNDVFTELRAHVPDRDIVFVCAGLHDCKGDVAMLRQVMVNLLWNAIKFTGKQQQARIHVSSKPLENDFIEYTVSDNGVGFNMQYADKLFGVFQRLHPHEEFDGSGVGLAIIQRIVSRHGGKVTAYGEENNGASFYVALPSTNKLIVHDDD